MAALGFEVLFGSLTITGSLMAFGKLQELLPSAADHVHGQNQSNIGLFVVRPWCIFLSSDRLAVGLSAAMRFSST